MIEKRFTFSDRCFNLAQRAISLVSSDPAYQRSTELEVASFPQDSLFLQERITRKCFDRINAHADGPQETGLISETERAPLHLEDELSHTVQTRSGVSFHGENGQVIVRQGEQLLSSTRGALHHDKEGVAVENWHFTQTIRHDGSSRVVVGGPDDFTEVTVDPQGQAIGKTYLTTSELTTYPVQGSERGGILHLSGAVHGEQDVRLVAPTSWLLSG